MVNVGTKWLQGWGANIFLACGDDMLYVTSANDKVFSVPPRLLVDRQTKRLLAFGEEARRVETAAFEQAEVVTVCRGTEILDEQAAVRFMQSLFQMTLRSFVWKPSVALALPSETTPFMREIWELVLARAGARQVSCFHQALALGAGVGLDLNTSHAYAIGVVSSQQVTWSLVTFNQVQHERSVSLPQSRDLNAIRGALAQSWPLFLSDLPTELMPTVAQEGCLLATSWDEPDWIAQVSRELSSPVVRIDPSLAAVGLRTLVQQHGEGQV